MTANGAIIFEKAVQEDLDIGVGQVDITNPGGGSIRGTRINLGSLAYGSYSATWAPGTVLAGNRVSIDVSIPGAVLADFVLVTFAGIPSQRVYLRGYVSAADVVTVVLDNLGVVDSNPGSATLRILLFKTNL